MKIKKIVAAGLITTLMVPQLAFGQGVVRAGDEELKAVILSVKEIVRVPSTLTQFQYNAETRKNDKEERYYTMRWYDEPREQGDVNVEVDEEGHLLSYSKNDYTKQKEKKVKLSYEKGYQVAIDFMDKALKGMAKEMKDGEYIRPDLGDTYCYIFNHYVNDIRVNDENVRVEVNKATGEVTTWTAFEPFEGSYEKGKPLIALEQAEKSYLEKIDIPLVYKIKRNEKPNSLETFPVYITSNENNRGIDARTGTVIIPFVEEWYTPYLKDSMQVENVKRMTVNGGNILTPEEEKAVQERGELLTKEEALAKASIYFKEIKEAKEASIKRAELSYDEDNKNYRWNLNLTKALKDSADSIQVQVDAKTGEVLYYSNYFAYNEEKEPTITYKEAQKEVEKFLGTIAPDKFKQTRLKVNEFEKPVRDYTFTYERIANSIPVEGNSLTVSYDTINKSIIWYKNDWNNLSFKALETIKEKDAIIKTLNLQLMYIRKDAKTKIPAYICPNQSIALDPYTGNRVNSYDGSPYYERNDKIIYDDLKNQPIEPIIKALYNRGIALEGKSFRPYEPIKQVDFMRLLMSSTNSDLKEETLYEYAVSLGILDKSDIAQEQPVTAIQAAHYIINMLGYKEIAKLQDIYNPTLIKTEIDPKDRGYITLIYGLGILDKTMIKAIQEDKPLSRAQGATLIYNMLNWRESK